MAAVAESAPAAGGIDDIVGGLRVMTTESAEGAGDTDALTTAELMDRYAVCDADKRAPDQHGSCWESHGRGWDGMANEGASVWVQPHAREEQGGSRRDEVLLRLCLGRAGDVSSGGAG